MKQRIKNIIFSLAIFLPFLSSVEKEASSHAKILRAQSEENVTLSIYNWEDYMAMDDNPEIDIVKYNWHGSSTDKIYLEPVIRHVDHGNVNYCEGVYRYSLIYKTEFSLNSQKAYGFKRVEKRDIYGVVKK